MVFLLVIVLHSFNEFVVVSPIEHSIIERICDEMDVLAGLGLSSHESLWCVTETTSKATLDQMITRLKEVIQ